MVYEEPRIEILELELIRTMDYSPGDDSEDDFGILF